MFNNERFMHFMTIMTIESFEGKIFEGISWGPIGRRRR